MRPPAVTLWIIAWALWSLTVWYQVNYWLPMRKAITECSHTHGKLTRALPDPRRGGRYTALVWRCSKCPLQVPLDLHRIGPTLQGLDEHSLWVHLHLDKDGR